MTSRRTFLTDLLSITARLCAALVGGGAVLSLAGCPGKKYGGPPAREPLKTAEPEEKVGRPIPTTYGGPAPRPTSRPAASRPAAP
jgi:hypothetical protein